MSRPRVYLTLLLGLTCTSPLIAQSRSISRINEIRRLSRQLRWVDAAQSGEYERTKAVITQRLLKELDTSLGESLRPDLMTAEPVTQAMDSALGYKRGDARHNVAFFADLPIARLLVVAIEIARGGPAIPEDAVSFAPTKQMEVDGPWLRTARFANPLPGSFQPSKAQGPRWIKASETVIYCGTGTMSVYSYPVRPSY